jgi:hypothetical protein
MPLALDPNETIWVNLDSDEKKNPRPEFEIRFLTRRELSRAARLVDESRDTQGTYDEAHAKLDQALAVGVVGWRNVSDRAGKAIPFSADKLDDILTGGEKYELAELMIQKPRLSEAEKKSSGSPATSAPESSVGAAKAEGAPTTTPTNP